MSEVRAAVYARMSHVLDDDKTKVEDQARICRELAGRHGWHVAEADVYTDNNRSAWQKNRKRPGWDAMLVGVGNGRIGAIVIYHGDRLVRQPYDLEVLLQLAEDKGVRLASPTGTRRLDSADDRYILRIEAAGACRESDNTSRRKKAQYERYRREGRVRPGGPGGRSFGYLSDNLTPVAAEQDAVREMAARILAGESLNAVCRDFNARGLLPTTGKPWRTGNMGPMLTAPRYAGLMPDGESAAAWGTVIGREEWERLRLVLDARGAFSNPAPTNARKWLLSGIAECGPCGAPLQISKARGGDAAWSYTCARTGCGKIRRNARHLDAYASAAVISRMAHPLNPEEQPVGADHGAEWAVLERERAETNDLLGDYKASAGRTRTLMTRLDAIDERMAELRDLAAGDGRARLLRRYAGITREQWEDGLALDVKRSLVAACFRVVVLPTTGRGPGFRVQDVRLDQVD